MDVSALVTVISILVAVYALVPRATRLTISLKMHWIEWSFVIFVIFSLHYLLFFEFFQRNGIVPESLLREYSVTRNEASYFLVIFSIILLVIRFKYFSIQRAKLGQLHKLVEELISDRASHAQLISLLSDNLPKLSKICRGSRLLKKLRKTAHRDKYDLRDIINSFAESGEVPEAKPKFEFPILQEANLHYCRYLVTKIRNREDDFQSLFPLLQKRNLVSMKNGTIKMLSVPIRWFPENKEEPIEACEILDLGFSNQEFVASIATLRPYFGMEVLEYNLSISHVFSDLYLEALIRNPTSVLYSELKNNQDIGVNKDFKIPVRNRLLGYLFHDVKIAEKFCVWRPIGEAVITDLEKRRLDPNNDSYNFPMHDFKERGCWVSEVYLGIRFFDLMVRKAIVQNVTWHMWLYYFSYITEHICANYKSTHINNNSIEEWPTRYSYLLYEIISALRAWISMIRGFSLNQENLILGQDSNGNPVMSSIIVMAYCLYDVANCKEMPDRFKRYLIEIALQLYFELRSNNKTEAYANYMFDILIRGGNWERANPDYLGILLRTFVYQDNTHYVDSYVTECMSRIYTTFREKWQLAELGNYMQFEENGDNVVLRSESRAYTLEL